MPRDTVNSQKAAPIDPLNQQQNISDNDSQHSALYQKLEAIHSDVTVTKTDMQSVKSEIAEIKESLSAASTMAENALSKAQQVDSKLESVVHIVDKDITSMKNELTAMKTDNKQLRDHILRLESQSRRDNLIFNGVQEKENENCMKVVYQILKDKMGFTNPQKCIKISRCHRLGPKSQHQTRPIIFKLHYFPDREMIWDKRRKLTGSNVFISEDFPNEIKQRRQQLEPIRRKAIAEGRRATLSVDRLIIDGRTYTTDTVDTLPSSLTPAEVFTKRSDDYTCFFSKYSPLSNFYPCSFKEGGLEFSSSEQYFQYNKALHCNDLATANQIRKTDDPAQCKNLARNLSIPDQKVWEDESLQIMYTGCLEKFRQNDHLKEFLLSTTDTVILEASPRDLFWGIGLRLTDPNICRPECWKGKNFLGKTLRKVRDHFMSSSD